MKYIISIDCDVVNIIRIILHIILLIINQDSNFPAGIDSVKSEPLDLDGLREENRMEPEWFMYEDKFGFVLPVDWSKICSLSYKLHQ